MPKKNKRQTKDIEIGMDSEAIENTLNNDNAFNERGLENASKLEQAMKKGNPK